MHRARDDGPRRGRSPRGNPLVGIPGGHRCRIRAERMVRPRFGEAGRLQGPVRRGRRPAVDQGAVRSQPRRQLPVAREELEPGAGWRQGVSSGSRQRSGRLGRDCGHRLRDQHRAAPAVGARRDQQAERRRARPAKGEVGRLAGRLVRAAAPRRQPNVQLGLRRLLRVSGAWVPGRVVVRGRAHAGGSRTDLHRHRRRDLPRRRALAHVRAAVQPVPAGVHRPRVGAQRPFGRLRCPHRRIWRAGWPAVVGSPRGARRGARRGRRQLHKGSARRQESRRLQGRQLLDAAERLCCGLQAVHPRAHGRAALVRPTAGGEQGARQPAVRAAATPPR
mmetsp:Transcript_30251/g.88505  ORF Transcript_30251/g.88505 Transcript_30251/m.88505 type:complete len:333 (+) Transcript_30251:401-1399(+)